MKCTKQLFKMLYGRNGMKNKNEILSLLQQQSHDSANLLYYSSVLTEFNKAMSNPDVQVDQLSNIIEKDPGLTASVLKMANSSFYGLSKRVATVKHAVSLLGYRALEKIFTVNLLNKALNKQKTVHGENLWKHSLATAIAAQQIIGITQPKYVEQIFTAGLLHDIGKFFIMNFLPEEFDMLMKEFTKNPYQYSLPLDNKCIGLDHQQIGAFFAELWMFPETVVYSIKYHHSIDNAPAYKDVVAAISIGNNIAKGMELGQSTSMLVELAPRWVWNYLGIKRNDFSNLIPVIQQKYNAYLAFLNIM